MPEVDYVVVSGPPGSGKTTIAALLAERLGLPLLGKDIIKEALMDTLGVTSVEESKRLGGAAIAVLLALAKANGRAVVESNWSSSQSLSDLSGLIGRVVEVFCDVDLEVSRERYLSRVASRHPGHFDRNHLDDGSVWQGPATEPVGGTWPVIRVDTSSPVDIEALTAAIATATHSSS